jgi:hypothetical protein
MEDDMLKKVLVTVLALALVVFAAACSPAARATPSPADRPVTAPGTDPDQPVSPEQPGAPLGPLPLEGNMERGNVFIDDVGILTLESFPLQFNLEVVGNLPTPCHQLRYLVNEPDAQNNIVVEVFSTVNPETMCIQVLQPFSETISLGSFPNGTYTILVNGQLAGQITTP